MEQLLKERILEFQQEGIPEYIKRDIKVRHIDDMITTIAGGRKTGKTYLTYQVVDDFIRQNIISSIESVCYLHFDDEALMMMQTADLSSIDRVFLALLPEAARKKNILFVFDEIHKIAGWENFVLRLKKKRNQFVIITGSTAELEEDKVAKQLRGKTFTNKLNTLSFEEFLRFKSCGIDLSRMSTSDRIIINQLFDEYVEFGSYPAIALSPSSASRELLQNYFNSVVASDFIFSKNIQNPLACKIFLRNLLQQNACPYTHKKAINNLKSIGYSLGSRTITEWYQWAEESYLIGTCAINTPSIKRIEQNYRKVYCIDWHLANTVSAYRENRISRVLENIVFLELRKQGLQISYELVGDQKYEIDFITSPPGAAPDTAFQVCVDINDPDVLEREIRGFSLLNKRYSNIRNVLIVKNKPNAQIAIPKGIEIITILDWIIGDQ